MTGRIYHPEDKHPSEYQKDLGPDASKGINRGEIGEPPTMTARDSKQAQAILDNFSDDELRKVPILHQGSRLEAGAKYLKLARGARVEIQALGDEEVREDELIVPKKEIAFDLWNRLVSQAET